MTGDIMWRGEPKRTVLRGIGGDDVEVTIGRLWRKPVVAVLRLGDAGWFWLENGVELRLAPKWVWNGLAFARSNQRAVTQEHGSRLVVRP
jgi:hypothetical protein